MQTYRARQFKSLLARLWQQSLLSDEFVQSAVDIVARTLGTDVAAIQAYDARADELLLVGTRGLARSGVGYVTLKLGQSMNGIAAKELRPVYTSDVRKEPGYVSIPTLDQDRYLSILAVPIVLNARLVGTLSVQTRESRDYGPRDIKELSEIASEIAPYLDELWRRDLASRLRGPSCLSRLEGFLTNRPTLTEIAQSLIDQLHTVFPVRDSTVVVQDADGELLFFGEEPNQDAREALEVACGPSCQKLCVDEQAGIVVPISVGTKCLGAIYVALGEGSREPLSSAANQVLESLARVVGQALSLNDDPQAAEKTLKERSYEELVQMVLDDTGLEALMARASELCKSCVAVTDRLGGLVAGTMPPVVRTNLPLKASGSVVGNLLIGVPAAGNPAIPAVAHAVAMELSKWNLRLEVERELRGDALDALIASANKPEEASMRAHLLGLDIDRPYVTVVFNMDIGRLAESRGNIFLRSLFTTLQRSFGTTGTSFVREHGFLVFVDATKQKQATNTLISKALEAIQASAPDLMVSCGIGPEVRAPGLYAQSIRQAQLAADLAQQLDGTSPVDASQIGAYGLLVGLQEGTRLQEFVDEHIGKLVDYDRRRGTQFVETLEAYHASGEKLRPAANALFIHVNTLKHRLERISSITGQDFDDVSQRFNLYLALYALRLLKPNRTSLLPRILSASPSASA